MTGWRRIATQSQLTRHITLRNDGKGKTIRLSAEHIASRAENTRTTAAT